jgi:hypothetical protein
MTGTLPTPHSLDFVIIGAMKAGTTTLFEYLKQHPDMFMPASKEVPFFTEPASRAEYDSFLAQHFSRRGTAACVGKATPHYLLDTACASHIHSLEPEIRMIAILRDPVERAYSHYRMMVRRELESRDFGAVADRWIADRASDDRGYFEYGLYGRYLGAYCEVFDADQLHVTTTAELERDPQSVLDSITSFLGIQSFAPESLGVRSHQGGTRQRLPVLRRIGRSSVGRAVQRRMPQAQLQRIRYSFNLWNSVPEPVQSIPLSAATLNEVQSRFLEDAASLSTLGMPAPWAENWRRNAGSLG